MTNFLVGTFYSVNDDLSFLIIDRYRKPDYYVSETDSWLVFPHEAVGLTLEEINVSKGPEIHGIFASLK